MATLSGGDLIGDEQGSTSDLLAKLDSDAGQLLSAMQRGEFTTEAALILADVMKLP